MRAMRGHRTAALRLVAGTAVVIFAVAPAESIAQEPAGAASAATAASDIAAVRARVVELIRTTPFEQLGEFTLRRARRAFAFGPFVGGTYSLATGPRDSDGAFAFGLALSSFKVPIIPDSKMLKDMLFDRALDRIVDELQRRRAREHRPPTDDEIDRIILEVIEDLLREFLRDREPQVLEKPNFHFHLEGAHAFAAGAWDLRSTLSIGIWQFSVGPTAAARFDDGVTLLVGPELSVQLLPWRSVRSPVVDLFGRFDFPVATSADVGPSAFLSIGARFVLDVI